MENILKNQQQFWLIIIGLALIIYGLYLFNDIRVIENKNGIVQLRRVFNVIYNIGGKYLILVIFEIIGILALVSGIKSIIKY